MQQTAKAAILSLFSRLQDQTSLAPSPEVDSLFSELVALCSQYPQREADALLIDPEITAITPRLRELCSEGEGELERHWAREVIASEHPSIALARFPYYDNYAKLTELEYRSLGLSGNRAIKRVLFVGAGPMPLSSIELATRHGLYVDNLDNDEIAIDLSTKLLNRLGLGDAITTMRGDAAKFDNYGAYDVVFLASLVGLEMESKRMIIDRIQRQLSPGSLLVARSAHGLRTLLYPPVDPELLPGLTPLVVIQPLNEIVNSVAILEKALTPDDVDPVIDDTASEDAASAFRRFCTAMISEVYRYPYNPVWHSDIDRAGDIYGQPRSGFFLVRVGDQIVASAAIRPYDRNYTALAGRYGPETASVWRFFIRPQYAGLGIEHLLQDKLETFAADNGYTRLYAHDQRDVPGALKKYIDNGYDVTYESTDRFGTVHFEKQLDTNS